MIDDAELIRRYAEEQSEDAFAELVKRHVPLVYSAALRRLAGDAHAAGDVTQLVFTALARQAASLVHCRVLPGWLYATTRNHVVDHIRREHRRRAREQEACAMHESNSAPPPPEWDQLRLLLDEVMDQLGQRDREAVLLRFFAHRSFAEIGRALGVSEDAARMRVDRALERLRILLAQRGAMSTCAVLGLALSSQAATAAPAGIAGAVTSAALHSAAAGPAFGLIELMSTSKTVAAAGIALVFAAGIALHEVRSAHAAETSLVEAKRKLATQEDQVNRSRQYAADAELRAASWRKSTEETRLAAEDAAVKAKPDPIGIGQSFLKTHPETTTLIANHADHRVTLLYGELFRRLNLGPAQIERFRTLALQLEGGVRWNTSTQAPFAEVNVGDLTRQQIDEQIRELLGPAGFDDYVDHTRNLRGQTRYLAEQIARSDYYSAAPLTPEQARRLTEIVAKNSPDFLAGRRVGLTTLDWDRTLAEAGSVLHEQQLGHLAALRDKALYEQAMRAQINQAVKEARTAAGVPPEY